MKSIAFFNNKGGVGKTSLVYHLSWMFADLGMNVLAIDLDPQANLTSMFLDEERIESLWGDDDHRETVYGSIQPILRGTGDISRPHVERLHENLSLIPGDLALSRFEDRLSEAWPRCHNRDEAAFRTMTAFYRMMLKAITDETQLVLIDVGPNLGAINRSALIASDLVCFPLAPDLFSLQGLRNLGPALHDWREVWQELLKKAPRVSMPGGNMKPIGYVVMGHGIRDSRPLKSYQKWINRIPEVYRTSVLSEKMTQVLSPETDPYSLSLLKHYRSLMPMAQEAHKPMFFLKPADGAIGAHVEAVSTCYKDFKVLAEKIASHAGLSI